MPTDTRSQRWPTRPGYRTTTAFRLHAPSSAPLFDQLIHKMMLRDVWAYWYLTSQSGKIVDPDITELRKP